MPAIYHAIPFQATDIPKKVKVSYNIIIIEFNGCFDGLAKILYSGQVIEVNVLMARQGKDKHYIIIIVQQLLIIIIVIMI